MTALRLFAYTSHIYIVTVPKKTFEVTLTCICRIPLDFIIWAKFLFFFSRVYKQTTKKIPKKKYYIHMREKKTKEILGGWNVVVLKFSYLICTTSKQTGLLMTKLKSFRNVLLVIIMRIKFLAVRHDPIDMFLSVGVINCIIFLLKHFFIRVVKIIIFN